MHLAHSAWQGVLTPKEAEVLGLVAAGWTTPEIARELWLSQHTVKFHIGNVFRSLHVTNRVQAARWWWEHVEQHAPAPAPEPEVVAA